MRIISSAVLSSILLATSARADSLVEIVDGTVFPANLGFTYYMLGNSIPADVAFTLNRGILSQHTLGAGYAGQGTNSWYKTINVPHASPYVLEARVRVNQSEQWSFPFGCYFAFGGSGVALMTNNISPYAGVWNTYAYDATQWHDYRFEVTSCGLWSLAIDNQLYKQGSGAITSGNMIFTFGDGTGGANANVDYDYVKLTVNLGIGADFNLDDAVDAADLAILLGQWGLPGVTDLDCSGTTDAGDLAVLLGAWG
jgi:hypothetical protein